MLSPDAYAGISVESDSSGNASSYTLSFSGIKAELPKSTLEKLSLAFSMFAPELPSEIKALDDKCFSLSSEQYEISGLSDISPCTAVFSCGQINYSITYDLNTGTPLLLAAGSGDSSVTLKLIKFKAEQNSANDK